MKKCVLAGAVTALLALSPATSQAEPAYWSGFGTTSSEEAAMACEEEDNLWEYGDGDFDQCYEEYKADLEMITPPVDPTDKLPTIPQPNAVIVQPQAAAELPKTN